MTVMHTAVEPAQIEYEEVDTIPSDRGIKHRIYDVTITGAAAPDVPLDPAQLGVRRLIHMRPQPLDGFWSVCWDGDTEEPVLSLDPYPEGESMTIRIEVVGK